MSAFFPVPPRSPAPRFNVLLLRRGAPDTVMTKSDKPEPRVFRSRKAAQAAADRMVKLARNSTPLSSVGWDGAIVVTAR